MSDINSPDAGGADAPIPGDDATAATPPPAPPGAPDAAPDSGTPGGVQPPQRKKKSGKGCLIALVVVLALIAGGGWFGWMWVQDKAEDAGVSLGSPTDILGGQFADCARFQAGIMFMSMSGIMTMGSEDLQSQLAEMDEIAPEAVRDDMRVFADALSDAMAQGLVGATTLGDGGGQSEAQQAENEAKVEEILNAPEVQQATENMGKWAQENCEGAEMDTGPFTP